MRVMITGAHGLVGRALAAQFRDHSIHALGHGDLDITNAAAVEQRVSEIRPHLIFNCAVIGVDDCEENPQLAEAVNVTGPSHLAGAAQRARAAIVHFSTNYIFDGERGIGSAENAGFYTIDDEPRPVNVYGWTKLIGERAMRKMCDRAFIIRTSWVFGQGKESFLATVARRLSAGERVKAICDVWASTTYVVDLVQRVDEIVKAGQPATYHVVNEGVCSYEEFAREAARLTGADRSLIDTVSESEMMRSPRPRYTPMRCLESERLGLKPLRPWTDALAAYVVQRS